MQSLLTTTQSEAPAQLNHSLIGGIECLLALAAADEPLGCRELARLLDLCPTRTNRLLRTLAYLGLAQKTSQRKYTTGSGLHVLAAMSLRGSRLLRIAMPLLEAFAARNSCALALGVLWGRRVCYVLHGSAGNLSANLGGHNLYPAAQSSIGKILLAEWDERAVRELYADAAEPVDPQFYDELRQVRLDGYAFGVTGSLAVPVAMPPVAGLAIVNRSSRESAMTMLDDLQALAAQIGSQLQ